MDLVSVILCMALFLGLACPQLDLPGLHYDEAKEAGLNALELLRGLPVEAFRGSAIRLGHTLLPLMVQDYIGSLNVYLALPFLSLFGIEVWSLRLLPIVLALGTLALTYALALYLTGQRTAAVVATALLAASPSFVFWSRQGIFVTNITATLAVASSLTALRWWRERQPKHLYWTALLWGLGLYAKLLFIWIVGASVILMAAGTLWHRCAAVKPPSARTSPNCEAVPHSSGRWATQAAVAAMLLLLPLTPLVLFNVETAGTWTSLTENVRSSYYGVSNSAVISNLRVRSRQVVSVLRGDHFWYLGTELSNPVAAWIGLALLVATVALLAARRGIWSKKDSGRASFSPLLAVVFCGLAIALSGFTVSDLFITHYAMLVPFLYLAMGSLVGFLSGIRGRVLAATLVLACAIWVCWDVYADVQYHEALASTGGHASHSDAIARLAQQLEAAGSAESIAMDWGIAAPVAFLTEASVRPVEVFGYSDLEKPGTDFDEQIRAALEDPSSVYIFHVPEEEVFHGRRERFDQIVTDAGKTPVIDGVVHERSGQMLFVVASVQEAAYPPQR